MPDKVIKRDSKKFMWDQKAYSDEAQARQKMDEYQRNNFETYLLKETGNCFLYTRRVVTEVVVDKESA